MLLCVTPNPALDRNLFIPDFRPGMTMDNTPSKTIAAGKGVSTARAAHALGAETLCTGFLGGIYGQRHSDLTEQEQLPGSWTWIEAETRTCYIIVDPRTHETTVLNEPGPVVTTDNWTRLHNDILALAEQASYVSFSGSLPLGSSPQAFRQLVQVLGESGHPVWVDTSGDTLRAALEGKPSTIKINSAEASAILGVPITSPEMALDAANMLRQRGIPTVIITLGADGAIMAEASGGWVAQPPSLEIVSAIGSGDALLGGTMTALSKGASLPEALRCGVASGGANALSAGAGELNLADYESVLAATTLRRLSL